MDFTFELATPQDDPALRQLLANSAMPGRITVAFEREPNYFLGCASMGHIWQIVIARHKPSGEIAAVLCRGIRPHFVNGQPQDLGYIGQIRIAEKYRGLWLLQRGLAYFRELHADGKAPAYWGVISDENAIARGVLVERPRRGFPSAFHVANIYTLGIILRRPLKPFPALPGSHALRGNQVERGNQAGQIERGSTETLGEIVAFLRRQGAARQFFPAYTETDFAEQGRTAEQEVPHSGVPGDSGSTLGFDIGDFFVARQNGEIRGVIGLWDQSAYKQTVVRAYERSLQLVRPLYDLSARLAGAQPLPRPGEHIHSAYASFICVAGEDAQVFAALLRAVYNQAAQRRYAYLMLGLAENDPLLPVARQYAHIAYHSQLYLGYWKMDGESFPQLDQRIPYIEIAAL